MFPMYKSSIRRWTSYRMTWKSWFDLFITFNLDNISQKKYSHQNSIIRRQSKKRSGHKLNTQFGDTDATSRLNTHEPPGGVRHQSHRLIDNWRSQFASHARFGSMEWPSRCELTHAWKQQLSRRRRQHRYTRNVLSLQWTKSTTLLTGTCHQQIPFGGWHRCHGQRIERTRRSCNLRRARCYRPVANSSTTVARTARGLVGDDLDP